MTGFIDRAFEMQTLERLYSSETGTLLILYGRRRVGKTALIQRFMANKAGLFFLATEENERENLSYFRSLLADYLSNDLLRDAGGLGWERLASLFAASEGKKLLVIDEFQYLCKANPAFSSVMQRLYDTVLKPAGVMVILCGSYINMMESETLNYDSPLYGRRDAQIRLGPIPFRYYHSFFTERSEDELVQYYAVTGGVPRYIEMLTDTSDIRQAVRQHILDPQSMLFEEPVFLLSHEVRELGSYFTVLKTIAAGNHRPSAIAGVMGIPQTNLSKLLSTLISLDILERRVPVTEKQPEKSKKALYRIKDHFLSFWFRFVYPYRSSLSLRDISETEAKLDAAFISQHTSYVYEDICAEKLWDMSGKKAFGCALQKVGNWWDARAEIDLMGLGTDGQTMVFAECKYHERPIGPSVLTQLQGKARGVAWESDQRIAHFVLFSRNGFERNLLAMAEADPHVHLVGPTLGLAFSSSGASAPQWP